MQILYKIIAHTVTMLHDHTDPTFLHIHTKIEKKATAASHYCQIHNRNKYANQIGYVCHSQKYLICMYRGDMHDDVCAIYELTGINHVTRSTVHRHQMPSRRIMMVTRQTNCISLVGHGSKSANSTLFLLFITYLKYLNKFY